MKATAFVPANSRARQVKLAPYTPITWSDTATLWNNVSVPATGRHFEVVVNFTPTATNVDTPLGFAGQGVADAASLVAGLRFGPDDRVTPLVGTDLVQMFYQAGVAHRIRAEFDLITHRCNIWVKPGSGAEQQLVANASLPASLATAIDLDTFAFLSDATTISDLTVTALPELSVAIISPSAPVVWLNNPNVALQLSGVISNATGIVPTTWALASGPGAVTFGAAAALTTTANFNAVGVYAVTFSASNTTASAT